MRSFARDSSERKVAVCDVVNGFRLKMPDRAPSASDVASSRAASLVDAADFVLFGFGDGLDSRAKSGCL